jgi:cell division protein ZapA
MTKEKGYAIRLLNKSYEIKCPPEERENLQRAAQKLNEQVLSKKNEFKKLGDFEVLLLAALHISHELVSCQSQQHEQRQQLAQFINTLETKISQVAGYTEPEVG